MTADARWRRPAGSLPLRSSHPYSTTFLMFFKDWYTSVHCDGGTVNEYDFRIVDDQTVSCYIPSEAGKVSHIELRAASHCLC